MAGSAMEILLLGGYILLCLLVGTVGRPTRAGFWGTFLIALLITPFLAFLFVVLFGRRAAA